jgi:hypothetical protein
VDYIKKKILKVGSSDGVYLDNTIKFITGFKRNDIVRIYCEKGKMIVELDKKEEDN